jgi:hypothetical protein
MAVKTGRPANDDKVFFVTVTKTVMFLVKSDVRETVEAARARLEADGVEVGEVVAGVYDFAGAQLSSMERLLDAFGETIYRAVRARIR